MQKRRDLRRNRIKPIAVGLLLQSYRIWVIYPTYEVEMYMIKQKEKDILRWLREIKKYREGKPSNTITRIFLDEWIQECKDVDKSVEETLTLTEKTLEKVL